jgi:uncharacterized protein YndB with AHSA1/START domain
MEKLTFNTTIDAPREQVWKTLFDDDTYRQWTSPFSEGSYMVADLQPGGRVLFLANSDMGMVARVAEITPYEYMSFEVLGQIKDGVEDTESEEVKQWAGGHENYTLTEVNSQTHLLIETDVTPDYKDYMEKTWPAALDKLKEIAEKQ